MTKIEYENIVKQLIGVVAADGASANTAIVQLMKLYDQITEKPIQGFTEKVCPACSGLYPYGCIKCGGSGLVYTDQT